MKSCFVDWHLQWLRKSLLLERVYADVMIVSAVSPYKGNITVLMVASGSGQGLLAALLRRCRTLLRWRRWFSILRVARRWTCSACRKVLRTTECERNRR